MISKVVGKAGRDCFVDSAYHIGADKCVLNQIGHSNVECSCKNIFPQKSPYFQSLKDTHHLFDIAQKEEVMIAGNQ